MPVALLGTNYDKRGRLPPVRVVNRYAEQVQSNQVTGVALFPRPGLALLDTDGAGPIRGVYRKPGLFDGDRFSVSDDELYRDGTLVDNGITGTDRIRWAGTDVGGDLLFFVANGILYLYDGATLATVAVPSSGLATDVTEINGYIIVQIAGSGLRYFIEPGDTTINPLRVFTAESSPDSSVATIASGSELYLFDEQTTEVWVPTGVADAPFQRVEGRTFQRGATARDTVLEFDNTIFFVGEDSEQGRVIYRIGDVPERVSTPSIEEKLADISSDMAGTAFIINGHPFYIVHSDNGSFALDVSTGLLSEWQSYGRDNWRAHVACAAPGYPIILGDDTTGALYTLDIDRGNDNDEPIIRTVGGGVPLINRQSFDSLSVICTTGTTTDLTAWPVIRARFSRDGGETWGSEKQQSIGRTGQYGKRVVWNRLGQFRPPGMLFELIDSDDVQMTISYALVNEPY